MASNPQLPEIADIKNFPRNNPKAILIFSYNKIRVVERHYYWDKKKGRGLEKRTYLGYVVDNEFLTNEEYQRKYNKRGKARIVPMAVPQATNEQPQTSAVVDSSDTVIPEVKTSFYDPLSTVLVGELPLYYEVAKDIGLIDDLTAVWGEELAKVMLSLAFHWLSSGQNACYLYNSWSEGRLLPYTEPLVNKEISSLLKQVVEMPGWRKSFFNARIKRLPDDEMLSFDATEIASEAQNITDAQYGKGKEGDYQKQVGLILLVGHKTHMPVLFRVLPGNITDVTTVQDMLFRFDEINDTRRVFAAVLDRGYFSTKNLASFIDKGSRVIIATKTNISWVKKAIDKVLHELWMSHTRISDTNLWGITVPVDHKFEDGKTRRFWVHIYRSDMRSHYENADFFEDLCKFEKDWLNWEGEDPSLCPLNKSPLKKYFKKDIGVPGISPLERDHYAIDEATRFFGTFCNVTTMECSAREALLDYQARDLIEKCFKSGKSGFSMDVIRAHQEKTMEGRLVISFIAMSILSNIYVRMKKKTEIKVKDKVKEEKPLSEETSFNEIKNRLATARLVYDGKGNKQWMEITKKQQEIARRLGYPNLYITVPSWGDRI